MKRYLAHAICVLKIIFSKPFYANTAHLKKNCVIFLCRNT